MNHTREELRKIFLTLPEDLQEAVTSVETAEAIKKIREKYNLHIDKAGDLGDEVGRVMIGVSSFRDFAPRLKERLHLTDEQAHNIANDVNTEIFAKIRQLLRDLELSRILADAPEVAAPATTSATNTTTADTIKKSLFDQKMGTLYNIPKEDVDVSTKTSEANRPFDPYRETA